MNTQVVSNIYKEEHGKSLLVSLLTSTFFVETEAVSRKYLHSFATLATYSLLLVPNCIDRQYIFNCVYYLHELYSSLNVSSNFHFTVNRATVLLIVGAVLGNITRKFITNIAF